MFLQIAVYHLRLRLVQYKNKKGNAIDRWVKIPIGRKKRGFQIPEPYMTKAMLRKQEKQPKQGVYR